MKKILLLSLVVAFAFTVNAQTSDKKWAIGAGAGAYGTLKSGGIGLMPELYFSRFLSPRLDLMLKGDLGLFRSGLKSNLDLANAFLNLRLKLSDETKNFQPYLFAGPGYLADNTVSNFNFDAGLGAKHYFNESLALYLEAGYINGIEYKRDAVNIHDNLWKATAGLEFDFGKAKDSDMDGVVDRKDKCPGTPAGVAVDANGCAIDSDGDGVADYLDDCPTVAGLTSLKGCPDTDKDGIADKDDACPDVAGPASLKGCPDSDGDGVADKDDKCPATKKGFKVDASGCPLDSDKDGVADSEDNCPTVAGTVENKGCPVVEAAVKDPGVPVVENVYFDYDQSNYITGEKKKIDHVVSLLKENKDLKVNLIGYTDSKGTEEYNMALSKRRLNSVAKTMTAGGIKKDRISQSEPKGEANPDATNDTEAGRAQNRRVEFEFIK
ncbi:MAG TPA: OmpA family protein [Prolixibacteraceae bacterium]|jgi:outer membrane protein OmpA-like peptidoglycan-associated protein